MRVKIENHCIEADINSFGAELCSLKLKKDNTEYLWQADPKHWARYAPVLFPIVGRVANNEYFLGNETYSLTQHGFARDMEFELLKQADDHAEYRLFANEKTLEQYPSKFELLIGYFLQENELIIKYEVKNSDNKKMYFSIGAHPGFKCPLLLGECFEDYYLEFSTKETACIYPLDNGLILNQPQEFLNNENIIPLSYDLFKNDALVFKGLSSDTLALRSRKSSKMVRVGFKGFPYLGIWTKMGAPFICIEPWYGVTDFAGAKRQFSEKEGICLIQPNEAFVCQFSIAIS
jgi:galactose mutarotase-like enzyme